MEGEVLHVKVSSKFKVYYDGEAKTISGISRVGPFDILVGHANFFTLLVAGTITINDGTHITELAVTQGLLQVANNDVKVFVDI